MNLREWASEIKEPTFGGDRVKDLIEDLKKAQDTIDFFIKKPFWANEYLGRNLNSVVKSIREDKLPGEIKEILIQVELAGNKRNQVLDALVEDILK